MMFNKCSAEVFTPSDRFYCIIYFLTTVNYSHTGLQMYCDSAAGTKQWDHFDGLVFARRYKFPVFRAGLSCCIIEKDIP